MKTICILSNNKDFCKPLEEYLKSQNFLVRTTEDFAELSELDKAEKVNIVLIDFNILPVPMIKDEIKLELEIKNSLVILSVDEAKLKNYKTFWGADDIITKPINLQELLSRIMLRLYNSREFIDKDIVKIDNIVLDPLKYEVRVKEKVIDFTLKEYELLKLLIANPGRVYTRDYLLEKVWGYDYYGGTRTVDVHIRRIRSKIEINNNIYIETVRGVGYKFKESK